mgnify:CR=1 FL=1
MEPLISSTGVIKLAQSTMIVNIIFFFIKKKQLLKSIQFNLGAKTLLKGLRLTILLSPDYRKKIT